MAMMQPPATAGPPSGATSGPPAAPGGDVIASATEGLSPQQMDVVKAALLDPDILRAVVMIAGETANSLMGNGMMQGMPGMESPETLPPDLFTPPPKGGKK